MSSPTKGKEGIRRSGRARRQAVKSNFADPKNKRPIWTKVEKQKLLEGLKKIGEGDVLALSRFIKTKKPPQIVYYIATLKRKLREPSKSRKPDMRDYWVQKLKQLNRKLSRHHYDPLPISMLLTSLFEEHPKSTQPDGIDFKALYEYLFCEMAEVMRPQLNSRTRQFLYRSFIDLQNHVKGLKNDYFKELKSNEPPDEWPFSSNAMNPLAFPKVELNINV